MKTVRVLVLTLLATAFMAARPRPAAAADSTETMLLAMLVGIPIGLTIYYVRGGSRNDSVETALNVTSQPLSRETALDFAVRPSRQPVPARNHSAAWASGTILTF